MEPKKEKKNNSKLLRHSQSPQIKWLQLPDYFCKWKILLVELQRETSMEIKHNPNNSFFLNLSRSFAITGRLVYCESKQGFVGVVAAPSFATVVNNR